MEGQEACDTGDRILGGHDVLSSAFQLDRVRESLKRKGLLLGEAAAECASAAAQVAVAAPIDIAQEKNNVQPGVQPIWEDDARSFKDRDVAWILAREKSRKRNVQLRSPDFSAFGRVELPSPKGIQSLLVEGAQTGAIFGPAEKSFTEEKRSFDKTGCSAEITTITPGYDPSNREAAADGKMDPLTPEILQQTCRGRSPGSSADYTSSPEATDTDAHTRSGNFLINDRVAPFRAPAMANHGALAMLGKKTSTPNVLPRGAQLRVGSGLPVYNSAARFKMNVRDGNRIAHTLNATANVDVSKQAKEQGTKQELPTNLNITDKSTRKRKYQPKIRAENPRPRSRAKKASVDATNDRLRAEIPEIKSSASLSQIKSFARINQRRPKLKRRWRGEATAAAISAESPASSAPGCSVPPLPTADPAYQDAITQSVDFLRFLHDNMFSHQVTRLCPARQADSGGNGSLCTRSSHLTEEEADVKYTPAAEDAPSTPCGVPLCPSVSKSRDCSLLRSPWSPPSPNGASDVSDPWNNVDDITYSQNHFSAKSVRRALQFEAMQPQEEDVHLCQVSSQGLAAAPDIDLIQAPAEELSVTLNPGGPEREKELQVVAYNEDSKRMVVYRQRVPRVRRVRYKPKVNLDARTVRMFKILTIKAAGMGEGQEDAEDEKISWERSRQVWQHRAHHFISIMRQVQGNRSFSRWKGSVVDSVGGAFLTQNVSDFLSSNAFISLRARFPARSREESAAETTPKAGAPVEKVEKQLSISTEASLAGPAENPTPREGDHQRQEEGWNEPCHIVEDVPEEGSPSRHEAAAQGPVISTATQSLTERTLTSDEMACVKDSSSQTSHVTVAPEFEALTMLHLLNQQNVSGSDEPFFPLTNHNNNLSSQQELVMVALQPECLHTPSRGAVSGKCDHCEKKSNQQSLKSSWRGKRAVPGVLQKKLASVVAAQTTRVSSLTPVGQEENLNLVLAATLTLQLVLGMKPTTQEQHLRRRLDRLHEVEKKKALRSPKQQQLLQLRPGRALLRSSTDNYRYRRSVSFRLLAGEARASWEAGFVMKSQKAKWGPRRAAIVGDARYRRDPWTADCVDWNAVRKASVHEVAQVIKNRGMNNALAGRIKSFLDSVHRDQDDGSIDLEWIRWLPPEDAKAFLLSFRGVGIKSVECIRLLTLHHPSFPVDTNVGRILVRLGWVPLEPLPEETQLHLLELYPIQSQIQQYVWPRLCTLDQKTLYELHYQMITFGKVFCTKSKPNCNACPMRMECKHYASSYASAKLLLKGRQEQEEKATTALKLRVTEPTAESTQFGPLSGTPLPCVPIIEEPSSPEPNTGDMRIPDIEELPVDFDTGAGVYVEIVNIGPSSSSEAGSVVTEDLLCVNPDVRKTRSLDLNREPEEETNVMLPTAVVNLERKGTDTTIIATMPNHDTRAAVEDDAEVLQTGVPDDFKHLPSQELILLPPQPNMAPAPKLKNVQRLRTVHFVYELPDNHPLLFEMDKREADDPCFYLLAIWSPDEVPATMPKINDDESMNPFASSEAGCNEDPEQTTVRGTLLIPCKTAMRGWFPLNGTYFQVNEVFADHASSVRPIAVPRTLLWSLRRRFVYFSTAVSNLFRDMSQDEIQCCFQKGYVCLRAFDVATRQPRLLAPRLHQSGAKIVKAPAPRKGRPRKTTSTSKPQTQISTESRPPREEEASRQPIVDNEIPSLK